MSWFRGYALYCVMSENPEGLVDALRKQTALRNIKINNENVLEFACFYDKRQIAEKIIKDRNSQILKRKCFGLMYFLSKYKKRAGLIIGACTAVLSIFVSSFFVWDVSVEGNENVSDEEIEKQLEELGFKAGVIKKRVDIDNIINMLLVKDDRISWAAINFDGTVAHVELREAKTPKLSEKKENVNLVASHNGIIIRADALCGQAMVKKGDAVVKGQMLVSAFMEKRTGGSLLKGARGYVWASTERNYCVYVPLEYFEKQYTGRKNVKYTYSLLGKSIAFRLGKDLENVKCDRKTYEGKIGINEELYLPVKQKVEEYREYNVKRVRRSESEATEAAEKLVKERLSRDSPEIKIADIDAEYSVEEGFLVYKCRVEGVENIAVPLEFEVSLSSSEICK